MGAREHSSGQRIRKLRGYLREMANSPVCLVYRLYIGVTGWKRWSRTDYMVGFESHTMEFGHFCAIYEFIGG